MVTLRDPDQARCRLACRSCRTRGRKERALSSPTFAPSPACMRSASARQRRPTRTSRLFATSEEYHSRGLCTSYVLPTHGVFLAAFRRRRPPRRPTQVQTPQPEDRRCARPHRLLTPPRTISSQNTGRPAEVLPSVNIPPPGGLQIRALYRVATDRSTGSELTAHAGARRPTPGRGVDYGTGIRSFSSSNQFNTTWSCDLGACAVTVWSADRTTKNRSPSGMTSKLR